MTKDELDPFLTRSIQRDVLSSDDIVTSLPPGWEFFGKSLIYTLDKFRKNIQSLTIKNGVLYIEPVTLVGSIFIEKSLDLFLTGIKTISSRTCMSCGKSAKRRKILKHSPPLCRPCFLDYINS